MQEKTLDFPKQYEYPVRVTSFDADKLRRVKLSSVLKFQQEAGELHLREGGLPYEQMYDDGMIFVTLRSVVKFYKRPVMDDSLIETTWHRDNRGVQFYRSYQFHSPDGELLMEGTSSFALIDPHTRKLLRPKVFMEYGIKTQPERVPGVEDPKKLKLPEEKLALAGERVIRYSDIDYNGHLNNTVYADILMDYLPENLRDGWMDCFTICFMEEALEGDKLSIFTAQEQDEEGKTIVWMRGKGEDGTCFEAQAVFLENMRESRAK